MGNKRITEKDFWICSSGNVPAPMQSTQETTSKKGGEKYITIRDTSTSSVIDFGCKKAMLIYAIIAAAAVVIAALVVGTGGAALIALGALAGLAGAAWGAVVGALLCGQTAAKGRQWIAPPKANMTAVQGVQQLTGDCTMTCVVGGTVSFAPEIKSWSQAIALASANYIGGLMEGMMAGAAIGMGGAAIGGGASAFAAGGMRGVGQAAWQFARSMPKNFVVNAVESVSKFGLALRGVMGVQNTAATYGTTGSAGVGDFFEGTVAMETGTVDSFNNIRSGQGTWQDYVGMAMLWAPVGQGKRDVENAMRNEPDGSARDGDSAGKPDDAGTGRAENLEAEPTGKKGDGEAFEDGVTHPREPSYQQGQSDGGPGAWEQRATPSKGADYQQKVTGSPKDIEYVVRTDKMKSGEKKFDGYDPETNTLIDAKDWDKWPPNGESKFDQMIRNQEVANVHKDAEIAANNGSNLEYHVPTESKKQQILEMLGTDIPDNFDIIVTSK